MRRVGTVLTAALEALIVVAVVLIPIAAISILLWGLNYGFSAELADVLAIAGLIWFAGHGVTVNIALNAEVAAQLGLEGNEFGFSLMLIGLAIITAWAAYKSARRLLASKYPATALIASFLIFLGVLALGSAAVSRFEAVQLHPEQAIFIPALIVALGYIFALLRTSRSLEKISQWFDNSGWLGLSFSKQKILGTSFRVASFMVLALVAAAAILSSIQILISFSEVITLYERLQAGVLGGGILTMAQLLVLPNIWIWVVAWIGGPGFSIGLGTVISPFETTVGALPALPIFGAVPEHPSAYLLLIMLLVVGLGFLGGLALQNNLRDQQLQLGLKQTLFFAIATIALTAVFLSLLFWASSGAIGPDRMQDIGPNPLISTAVLALELALGFGAAIAMQINRNRNRG